MVPAAITAIHSPGLSFTFQHGMTLTSTMRIYLIAALSQVPGHKPRHSQGSQA